MKVMTFNIQHALDFKTKFINTDLFANAIKENGIDLCGLNEEEETVRLTVIPTRQALLPMHLNMKDISLRLFWLKEQAPTVTHL
ncbi:MAG: hypothetical protein IKU08_02990 [Clostridia bacterium]|nr:hypothetical protein [Clostridia bacterium]